MSQARDFWKKDEVRTLDEMASERVRARVRERERERGGGVGATQEQPMLETANGGYPKTAEATQKCSV